MRSSSGRTHNPLGEYVLHMGAGFVAKERPHVLEVVSEFQQQSAPAAASALLS